MANLSNNKQIHNIVKRKNQWKTQNSKLKTQIFLLIGFFVSIPSFAGGMTCQDVNGVTECVDTVTASTDTTNQGSTTPPIPSGVEGVATAGYQAAKADEAAALCQLASTLTLKFIADNQKCVDDANTVLNDTDNNTCKAVEQSTSTNGITLSGGGTIGHSSVTISGISVEACKKNAQDNYATKIASCKDTYTNNLAAAKQLAEFNCPKK